MYVASQPPFLNAVAELRTSLSAVDLLSSLKKIESDLGRVPSLRYGPRSVDLDIILYNSEVINVDNGRLQVPHPRLHERDFVLQPLCDIDASVRVPLNCTQTEPSISHSTSARLQMESVPVPGQTASAGELLRALQTSGRGKNEVSCLTRVLPLPHSSLGLIEWSGHSISASDSGGRVPGRCPAKLMGIINATPDSFSDGGRHETSHAVLARCEEFVRYGFVFVDVGGQSTRPGAPLVSADEEIRRVVKHIGAIRKEFPSLAISVDTFRAKVAAEAFDAGADLVNDVSAGRLDADMLRTVYSKRCPWALMHMRGTPETMMSAEMTDYGDEGAPAVTARELRISLDRAAVEGIPRWDIIVDPGYGFAKSADQSLDLARKFAKWKSDVGGYPTLVGLSRKSSLTSIVTRLKEESPESRDFASAGAAVAAMYAGADVVRVHNPAVADTVAVAHEMRCAA